MSYAKEGVEIDTRKGRKYNHDHKAANDWIRAKFGDLHFLRRDEMLRKVREYSEAWFIRGGGTRQEFENLFDNNPKRAEQ